MKYYITQGYLLQTNFSAGGTIFMQQMQIFNSPEFGEVRTILITGEPWFVGKDVATVLGYAKPTDAIRKRIDNEDRGISKMETPSGVQEMVIINESGLYSLIFGSKLDSAKKFKHWVTSEVLPSLRKNGSYGTSLSTSEQIKLLAQGTSELYQKVDTLTERMDKIEMDLPILPIEADRITTAVRKKGVEVLGGKESPAYKNRALRQKLYNNLYANLKYNFGCKSYKAIKRSQTDKAVEIVERYAPPVFLSDEIEMVNTQMMLDL